MSTLKTSTKRNATSTLTTSIRRNAKVNIDNLNKVCKFNIDNQNKKMFNSTFHSFSLSHKHTLFITHGSSSSPSINLSISFSVSLSIYLYIFLYMSLVFSLIFSSLSESVRIIITSTKNWWRKPIAPDLRQNWTAKHLSSGKPQIRNLSSRTPPPPPNLAPDNLDKRNV